MIVSLTCEYWIARACILEPSGFPGFVTLLNEEREKTAGRKPQATAERQVSIAAARKPRWVDAEVRWRWTLKVL